MLKEAALGGRLFYRFFKGLCRVGDGAANAAAASVSWWPLEERNSPGRARPATSDCVEPSYAAGPCEGSFLLAH